MKKILFLGASIFMLSSVLASTANPYAGNYQRNAFVDGKCGPFSVDPGIFEDTFHIADNYKLTCNGPSGSEFCKNSVMLTPGQHVDTVNPGNIKLTYNVEYKTVGQDQTVTITMQKASFFNCKALSGNTYPSVKYKKYSSLN